jgi:ABC-type phosphate transport system permease subunit
MKPIELAKYIDRNGRIIIFAFAFAVIIISGFIFYYFAWRSVVFVENSGFSDNELNKNKLTDVLSDIDERANALSDLKREQLSVPDIFQ